MRRTEPSPLLVAVLAAAAGLGGAWLADGPGAPAAAPEVPGPPGEPGVGAGASLALPATPRTAPPTPVGVWVTGASGPAAGADLELQAVRPGPGEPALVARATLDAQGHLALKLVPGAYLVSVRQAGAAASQAFEVVAGHAQELLLRLGETWTARLTVVDAESRRALPSPEARLARQGTAGPDPSLAARGDSLGRLELAGLPPGLARVRVTAREYLPSTVELAPGRGEPEVVGLERAAFVTGTVVDENGTLLSGVRVRTADLDPDTTDAAGRFRAPCRPGDVAVVALDPAGRSATARVHVEAGATASGLVLRLGVPRRVTGVVAEALGGAPVPGALVWAEALGGVEVARTRSSATGTFELDGLPPGWVNVRAALGRGARAEALGVATEGPEPVVLRLELSAAAAVWGVVSAEGQPVPGATVQVERLDRQEPGWSAVTDAEGTYQVEDLPPVPVMVQAVLEGAGGARPSRVLLTAGAVSQADLTLERDGVVEGAVRGPPGRRFLVAAFNGAAGRVPRTVPVTAGGRYRMRLSPGQWRLGAYLDHDHLSVFDDEEVEVVAGQTVSRDLEVQQQDAAALEDSYAVEAGTLGASFDGSGGEVRFAWLSARGPAARAGIAVGEGLVAVDGAEVRDSLQAFERTRGAPGSPVSLVVKGSGGTRTVSVTRQADAQAPGQRAQAP